MKTRTIHFYKSIYSLDSIQKTISVFSHLAAFSLEEADQETIINAKSDTIPLELLLKEFENYLICVENNKNGLS